MWFERVGIYPSDLETCKRVFEKVCIETQVAPSSVDGEFLASCILAAFQSGERNETKLLTVIRSKL